MSGTIPGGWPDKPGVPMNLERDGWHWFGWGDREMPAYWDATKQEWIQGGLCCGGSCSAEYAASDTFRPRIRYLGPCHTPAEVAALVEAARAEGERLREPTGLEYRAG